MIKTSIYNVPSCLVMTHRSFRGPTPPKISFPKDLNVLKNDNVV